MSHKERTVYVNMIEKRYLKPKSLSDFGAQFEDCFKIRLELIEGYQGDLKLIAFAYGNYVCVLRSLFDSYIDSYHGLEPWEWIEELDYPDREVYLDTVVEWLSNTQFKEVILHLEDLRHALTTCDVDFLKMSPLVGYLPLEFLVEDYEAECALSGDGWYFSDVRKFVFQSVNIIVSFLRKLRVESEPLYDDAITSWLATESRISQHYDTAESLALQEKMNHIIQKWLRDITRKVVPCSHGSGSTAPVIKDNHVKYLYFDTSSGSMLWLRLLGKKYKTPSLFKVIPYMGIKHVGRSTLEWISSHHRSCTRMVAVRKTYKSVRLISCEGIEKVWAQEGFMKCLYKHFYAHKYLKKCIDVSTQERNQHLAQIGSRDGSLATVDLSAASDSVRNCLVKRIFHGTWPYLALQLTRSKWVDISQLTRSVSPDLRELHKFAPMGNALTFPVEVLVFGSVCQVVQEEMTGRQDRPLWSVYGDDIIVPTSWVSRLYHYLDILGFIVNEDKSFSTGFFRESCGKEYFHGEDVSPLYFKVEWDGLPTPITAEDFTSICSILQRLDNPFSTLSQYREDLIEYMSHAKFLKKVHFKERIAGRVVKKTKVVKQNVILPFTPFDSDAPFIYGAPEKTRLNGHYQTEVYCTQVHVYKPERKLWCGDLLALQEWLANAEFRAPSRRQPIQVAPDWNYMSPPELFLKNGWAEVPSDGPYRYRSSI